MRIIRGLGEALALIVAGFIAVIFGGAGVGGGHGHGGPPPPPPTDKG